MTLVSRDFAKSTAAVSASPVPEVQLVVFSIICSTILPLICLSLLLPWAGEGVAGIGMLVFFCSTPALPASWTYSPSYS